MENEIKITSYHPEWQKKRILWILEKFPVEFWKDKRVLELAPCNGVIGDFFRSLGAKALCVEGRRENIEDIANNFPGLDVVQGDLDTVDWPYGQFDIIINFGLFYHLENFHKEHLINCINNCKLLLFESLIFDSAQSEMYRTDEKVGNDQSLSGVGYTPSTKYIEDIFRERGCPFTKYSDKELDSDTQTYSWIEENKRNYSNKNRRMWIVIPSNDNQTL